MPPLMGAPPPESGEAGTFCEKARPQGKAQHDGFCFPSPASVKGRVLGALLAGETLSHLECWRRFGSSRLSHHAYSLRGIGWPVQMDEQTVVTSDGGRTALIGFYTLPPEAIAEAGDRGQEFAAECARINSARRAE